MEDCYQYNMIFFLSVTRSVFCLLESVNSLVSDYVIAPQPVEKYDLLLQILLYWRRSI